jgi:two-component system OmpR family response regulator
MRSHLILHIDDDPDIRAVVAMALELDSKLAVRSSGSGEEGLAAAMLYAPDLILLDVMMPAMDGPTTLAHLQARPETEDIPVVFMTARAQKRERDQFMGLGVIDVIAKPFDPLTLAEVVRGHLHTAKIDQLGGRFLRRLRTEASTLAEYRGTLSSDPTSSVALAGLQSQAHKLAGAAGVFGFPTVSRAASLLEGSVIDRRAGRGTGGRIETDLDSLLDSLRRR